MKGFSLIETMIYSAILSILITASFTTSQSLITLLSQDSHRVQFNSGGDLVTRILEEQIISSKQPSVPYFASSTVSAFSSKISTSGGATSTSIHFIISNQDFNFLEYERK